MLSELKKNLMYLMSTELKLFQKNSFHIIILIKSMKNCHFPKNLEPFRDVIISKNFLLIV